MTEHQSTEVSREATSRILPWWRRQSVWVSLAFAVVAAAAAFHARGFYGSGSAFPMAVGTFIAVLAGWNALTLALEKDARSERTYRRPENHPESRGLGRVLTVYTFILSAVYVAGLPIGGALGVAAYFKFMERFPIWKACVIGVTTGAAVWFVFGELAGLPVYRGLPIFW